jgi:hypothetical protein
MASAQAAAAKRILPTPFSDRIHPKTPDKKAIPVQVKKPSTTV